VGWVRNPAGVPANPATPEPRPRRGQQPRRAARPARRLARLIGAGLAGCLAAGCGAGATPSGHGTSTAPAPVSASAESTAASPPSSRASAAGRGVSKILVIIEENHSTDQVFPDGMPYLWQLARRYGHATRWDAITHPSLPNYLAIFSGSAFNEPENCSPGPGCTYPGPSVFGQALALGKTARSYQESMPRPCDPENSGDYAVRHNPWAYIPGEAAACRSGDVPAGTPSGGALVSDARGGTLPTVGMITPNLVNDAHDGTLAQADAWLRLWMPVLMSGPDWRRGRLAIVVTFDEGEPGNRVPFVLIAPGVSGAVMSQPADHYSLTRLIDEVIGARPLRQAASAPSIARQLGLALPAAPG
jgi:phosphatidylinositol-3-phosphatase